MDINKKIIYTESAKARLDQFHIEVDRQLEDYFRDRKFVPGDDFIEVTGMDIDEVANRFRFIRPTRTSVRSLIPAIYTFFGVTMTLIGLFYEQIVHLIQGNPVRLVFIISGIFMVLVSWFYLYYMKIREHREEQERIMYDKERMMFEAELRHRQKLVDE